MTTLEALLLGILIGSALTYAIAMLVAYRRSVKDEARRKCP